MKKYLLATLATEDYLDQAKQVFSSAYWNAGWTGDYMLLAHEIPEEKLAWFKEKGILIYSCRSLVKEKKYGKFHQVLLSKFYLFDEYFKKWEKIIYLDADTVVRASLDELTKTDGFNAVLDCQKKLSCNFIVSNEDISTIKIIDELKKQYDLSADAFNAGFFVLDTSYIKKETFEKIKYLIEFCKPLTVFGDQPVMNLLLYKNWKKLPLVYNSYPLVWMRDYGLQKEQIQGIILHFVGENIGRPWNKENPFYEEWKHNLERAHLIDLSRPRSPEKFWSKAEIKKYETYIKFKHFIYLCRKKISIGGLFYKKNNAK